uniref:Uncharacterized protein n=1 Tax=viral metagenome TaxID=1070528 RepID=A0A6C0DAU1_9ZZZZ
MSRRLSRKRKQQTHQTRQTLRQIGGAPRGQPFPVVTAALEPLLAGLNIRTTDAFQRWILAIENQDALFESALNSIRQKYELTSTSTEMTPALMIQKIKDKKAQIQTNEEDRQLLQSVEKLVLLKVPTPTLETRRATTEAGTAGSEKRVSRENVLSLLLFPQRASNLFIVAIADAIDSYAKGNIGNVTDAELKKFQAEKFYSTYMANALYLTGKQANSSFWLGGYGIPDAKMQRFWLDFVEEMELFPEDQFTTETMFAGISTTCNPTCTENCIRPVDRDNMYKDRLDIGRKAYSWGKLAARIGWWWRSSMERTRQPPDPTSLWELFQCPNIPVLDDIYNLPTYADNKDKLIYGTPLFKILNSMNVAQIHFILQLVSRLNKLSQQTTALGENQ